MKPIILTVFFFFVWVSSAAAILPDPPANVSLTPDVDAITIEWDSVANANVYYVHWGTTSEMREDPVRVETETEYTKAGLEPDTEYFFAVSAEIEFLGETDKSEIQSAKTLPEDTSPEPPGNFWITGLDDIAENSVRLRWDERPDSDIETYVIHYGEAPGQYHTEVIVAGSLVHETVDGLSSNTRYYFNISSVTESNGETLESEMAGEIIVDTRPDTLPPETPGRITGHLSGEAEITIRVDPGNENMVDYKGVVIYYGRNADAMTDSVDIEKRDIHVLTGLPPQSTWYFKAAAYDDAGNESEPTDMVSVTVEEIESYTGRFDDFTGGCFVGSLSGSRQENRKPSYDVTENKHKAGISGGYYLPAETGFDDFYGHNNYPFFLFYERGLHRHWSVGAKAGYMRSSGKMRTAGEDRETSVDATYTMIPTSASINFKYPIVPYVWGFVGVGPDFWYIRETSDLETFDSVDKWVGGYHGRAGIWLYNMDTRYRQWGMLFETQYSVVDRFGKNDIDVGGWLFLIGGFYSF